MRHDADQCRRPAGSTIIPASTRRPRIHCNQPAPVNSVPSQRMYRELRDLALRLDRGQRLEQFAEVPKLPPGVHARTPAALLTNIALRSRMRFPVILTPISTETAEAPLEGQPDPQPDRPGAGLAGAFAVDRFHAVGPPPVITAYTRPRRWRGPGPRSNLGRQACPVGCGQKKTVTVRGVRRNRRRTPAGSTERIHESSILSTIPDRRCYTADGGWAGGDPGSFQRSSGCAAPTPGPRTGPQSAGPEVGSSAPKSRLPSQASRSTW